MEKRSVKNEEVIKEKRRGKGEGTIYQRPEVSWCAIVNHGVVNGKRRRTSLYGKTRKEVVAKLRKLQLDEHQGLVADGPKQTVAQYLDSWLSQVVTVRNKSRTLRSYQDMVRLHLSPHLGRHQLDKLTTSHVQVMLNKLPDAKLSPRSVQYAKGVLCRALNVAVKWGLIPRNVAAHAEAPSGSSRAIAPLTEAQAHKLLSAVKGHRLEALYRIALSLGLRRGEVVGLRWEDIDLDAATLRVSGALQRINGKLVRSTPKTAASAATLPLPEVLVRVLRQHQERQALEQANTKDWQEHGYVFPSERGTPLEPQPQPALQIRPQACRLTQDDPRPRPAPLVRDPADRPGRPPARGDGDPAPLADQRDDEHLRPRHPRAAARRHRQDRRAVRYRAGG